MQVLLIRRELLVYGRIDHVGKDCVLLNYRLPLNKVHKINERLSINMVAEVRILVRGALQIERVSTVFSALIMV